MNFQTCFNNLHYFNILILVVLELAIYMYSLQCNCDSHLSSNIFINTRSVRSFKFPEERPRKGETTQLSDKAEFSPEIQLKENVKFLKNNGSLQVQRDKKTFFNFLTKEQITNEDAENIVTENKYHSLTGSIKRLDIKCPPCQVYTENGCQLNLFSFESGFDESCVIYNSSSRKDPFYYQFTISIIILLTYYKTFF